MPSFAVLRCASREPGECCVSASMRIPASPATESILSHEVHAFLSHAPRLCGAQARATGCAHRTESCLLRAQPSCSEGEDNQSVRPGRPGRPPGCLAERLPASCRQRLPVRTPTTSHAQYGGRAPWRRERAARRSCQRKPVCPGAQSPHPCRPVHARRLPSQLPPWLRCPPPRALSWMFALRHVHVERTSF